MVRSDATDSQIGDGATVGPFAYLRQKTDLGNQGKIGASYETKNVTIGTGSKLSHRAMPEMPKSANTPTSVAAISPPTAME